MRDSIAAVVIIVVLIIGLGAGYFIGSFQPSHVLFSTVYSGTTYTVTMTSFNNKTVTSVTTITTTATSPITIVTTSPVTTTSTVTTTSLVTTTSTATTTTSQVVTTTITSIPSLTLEEVSSPTSDAQYHGDYTHAGFINSKGPVNLTQIQSVNLGIGSGTDLGLTAYSPGLILAGNGADWSPAQYNLQTESLINGYGGESYIPVATGTAIIYIHGFYYGLINTNSVYGGVNLWGNTPSAFGPYVTVYGGLVIDAGGDGMEAVNIADGSVVWTNNYLTSSIGYTSGTVTTIPTVGGSLIVVGLTSPNVVMAFNVSNGEYVWSISLNSTTINNAPAYSGGYFYFTAGNYLYKVSLSGGIAWVDNLGVLAMDTPAVAYGALYLGTSNGLLLAINATTGSTVWYDDLNSSIVASPIVSINGVVYEATMGGMVYAINAQNGQVLSSYNIQAPVEANPVLTDGYLLILDNYGVLHVFKP